MGAVELSADLSDWVPGLVLNVRVKGPGGATAAAAAPPPPQDGGGCTVHLNPLFQPAGGCAGAPSVNSTLDALQPAYRAGELPLPPLPLPQFGAPTADLICRAASTAAEAAAAAVTSAVSSLAERQHAAPLGGGGGGGGGCEEGEARVCGGCSCGTASLSSSPAPAPHALPPFASRPRSVQSLVEKVDGGELDAGGFVSAVAAAGARGTPMPMLRERPRSATPAAAAAFLG